MRRRALGMFTEFKEFALKGNAIALAVGVVMGAAFNAIIASIVENLFKPPAGTTTIPPLQLTAGARGFRARAGAASPGLRSSA